MLTSRPPGAASTVLTHRRRKILAGAAFGVLAMLLPATAGIASAHNPSATLDCQSGLVVNLTDYNGDTSNGHQNTVAVSIDGAPVSGSPFTFGTSFSQTWTLDPTKPHTATVVVSAWDDPTGSNNWSRTFNLSEDACQAPPPTYCIDISKQDSDEQGLEGAVFTVTKGEKIVGVTKPTNSDGFAGLCGLAQGDYTVTETTPPAGYTAGGPKDVSLPSDNGAAKITFVDTPVPGCTSNCNPAPQPTPGSLIVEKNVGIPAGTPFSGTFTFTVTCGTTTFPVSVTVLPGLTTGQASAVSVPNGTTCTVVESGAAAPPAGFSNWGTAIYTPSTARTPGVTINGTTYVAVTNPSGAVLSVTATPALTVPVTSTGTSQPGGPGAALPFILLVLAVGGLGVVASGTIARRLKR